MTKCTIVVFILFFKQKTAYEMRISDWSSDVCSSDLQRCDEAARIPAGARLAEQERNGPAVGLEHPLLAAAAPFDRGQSVVRRPEHVAHVVGDRQFARRSGAGVQHDDPHRSEEHTSELQSLMRNSYAVLCLNKKKN